MTLVIAGSGDDSNESRLRALARELGLEGRVAFARLTRDELRAAYAESDLVLFSVQWEEPWSLVPLEAMAVGTPVVASGAGGSAEYLQGGENSLIYSPRDSPEALARCVMRIAGDGNLRLRLREEGLATAAVHTDARFNASVVVHLERAVEGSGTFG